MLFSYGQSQWKKKDYGYAFYRIFLNVTERLANSFKLKLSKENKAFFSEIHPWYEMVLGGIVAFFLCLALPLFAIWQYIIGPLLGSFGGGGSSSSGSSYSSRDDDRYSSRSSSYSSRSSGGGGGFGGGRSGGGGASR